VAMSNRVRILAWTFAGLSLLHALLGLFLDELPAWKMFRVVPRYRYELVDSHGEAVFLHDWVPRRAYVMSSPIFLIEIAQWLVETHPDRAPLEGTATIWSPQGEQTKGFRVVATPNGPQVLETAVARP
jgi:hypothetical protein